MSFDVLVRQGASSKPASRKIQDFASWRGSMTAVLSLSKTEKQQSRYIQVK